MLLVGINSDLHALRDAYRLDPFVQPQQRLDFKGWIQAGYDRGRWPSSRNHWDGGANDDHMVKFFSEPTRRHTFKSEFNVSSLPASLPPVEVLYAYSDAPGYLVDAMVQRGVKGIVFDGTGAGSLTTGFTEAAKRAQQKGVVVVATARTFGGRVQDTPRRREANIVPGDNLPPEKARLLLQLALTKTTDLGEITRVFNEY